MWKKLVDSKEVVSYELENESLKIRIEARLNQDATWNIFLIYHDGTNSSYTEEYRCRNQREALDLMRVLKTKRLKSKKELDQLRQTQSKALHIELKREYRDYNVEKWIFSIENGIFNNFVYIRESDFVDLDIVINAQYRQYEEKILAYLINNLGLDDFGTIIRHNLFYYQDNKRKVDNQAEMDVFINSMDFEFADDDCE